MRPHSWFLTTISLALILAVAGAATNIFVDVYGLYWPTQGRHLPVLGDSRLAKYLLSMRYVPENFNAVLSGASVSANWDITGIEKLRVFNESIDGGNIVEEKMLVEAALERPGIRLAFLLVHPAMTYTHDFKTVELTPELRHSALGSLSLLEAYKDKLKIRLGLMPQAFDSAGTESLEDYRTEMNLIMKGMWNAPDFTVDPIALQAYRELVAHLRAKRVQVVFIVPPVSEQLVQTKGNQLRAYVDRMRSEVDEGDPWIDFLGAEYETFRANRSNFSDGVHFRPDGAKQVVGEINGRLNQWIAERRLVIAEQQPIRPGK